ncbi:hypothetical protein L1887_60980 [Cichorium endivia]|nr:hypothetical protein L1887_60980 [Cichorium endivia]
MHSEHSRLLLPNGRPAEHSLSVLLHLDHLRSAALRLGARQQGRPESASAAVSRQQAGGKDRRGYALQIAGHQLRGRTARAALQSAGPERNAAARRSMLYESVSQRCTDSSVQERKPSAGSNRGRRNSLLPDRAGRPAAEAVRDLRSPDCLALRLPDVQPGQSGSRPEQYVPAEGVQKGGGRKPDERGGPEVLLLAGRHRRRGAQEDHRHRKPYADHVELFVGRKSEGQAGRPAMSAQFVAIGTTTANGFPRPSDLGSVARRAAQHDRR